MTEPSDDLADLLDPRAAPPSSALRDAILRRTESRLARVRWLRRAARAALVAGVFTAGGVSGWFSRPERQRPIELAIDDQPIIVPVPMPVPERPTRLPQPSPLTASAAELQAEQQDDPRAAGNLYRQAGDDFLREQDYANATRCYRLYID